MYIVQKLASLCKALYLYHITTRTKKMSESRAGRFFPEIRVFSRASANSPFSRHFYWVVCIFTATENSTRTINAHACILTVVKVLCELYLYRYWAEKKETSNRANSKSQKPIQRTTRMKKKPELEIGWHEHEINWRIKKMLHWFLSLKILTINLSKLTSYLFR